ncbi:hypothetical protein G6N74_09315 [Mesorhizobium sp. CGMCC 1.15528]|uniref:Uncharacterized protein n=1 Tax=Mesorhizobium zhangyense TaxID=1776730 RepID=A0A7C9R6I0_9HYPH|nr:hypothetical protein [Mesorhizobium zhangyense]NGN41262.1 hypothetical protein [Mesorhizobium zhangyense]
MALAAASSRKASEAYGNNPEVVIPETGAKRRLSGTYWPQHCQARPGPRNEMLALLHSMATDAGIPEKCEDAACRRSGICRAETLGEQGPPCGAHWPDALVQRFEGACEGMALSWILEERRADRARNALVPPQPAQPRASKKRPVSKAR